MLGMFAAFLLIGCLTVTATLKLLELLFRLIYRILLIGKSIDDAVGTMDKHSPISTKEFICYARRLGHYYGCLELKKIKIYKLLGFTTQSY